MRFLCCCCCRRPREDEETRANTEPVETARGADFDDDSPRANSLEEFRFKETDELRVGRSPGNKPPPKDFYFVPCEGPTNNDFYVVPCHGPGDLPPRGAKAKQENSEESVPLVLGPDSPPIVPSTAATTSAAAPAKPGLASNSASEANAKLASIAASAASIGAAKSARASASNSQGGAKTVTGATAAAPAPKGGAKTVTGATAAAPAPKGGAKTVTGATAAAPAPNGGAKTVTGATAAAPAPKGGAKNASATTTSAAAPKAGSKESSGATAAPKANTKVAAGAATTAAAAPKPNTGAASATLPKTTTAAAPKAAASASAASAPQKNAKVSPTERAPVKATKAATADETVCASLLSHINQLRISQNCNPLRLCDRLRPVALSAWKAREAAKDGLAVMPKCQTTFKPKTGEATVYDCLSYLDAPLHTKEGFPAAAIHFWEHLGSYKTNSGLCPLTSPSAYPAAGSQARRELDACKADFKALLTAGRNTRVYLHLARAGRTPEGESEAVGSHPLAVVAVFAPDDAKP